MARHKNKEISDLGRKLVDTWFKENLCPQTEVEGESCIFYTNKQGQALQCLLVVSTKMHDIKRNEKVTGLDVERVQKLQAKAKDLGLDDVLAVFVDAKLKQCYAGQLSVLMTPKRQFELDWPLEEITHMGRQYFFSLFHLPTLFHLPEDFSERIGHLSAQNRVDKSQGYLF